jgi:hypothetical protein
MHASRILLDQGVQIVFFEFFIRGGVALVDPSPSTRHRDESTGTSSFNFQDTQAGGQPLGDLFGGSALVGLQLAVVTTEQPTRCASSSWVGSSRCRRALSQRPNDAAYAMCLLYRALNHLVERKGYLVLSFSA